MGVITFNGIASNSKRFSVPILVEKPPEYSFPSRDAELTHVVGRNGDIFVDNGSYNNVTRTYDLVMASEEEDYVKLAYELSSWLHSANGYAKLTDSYDPDHYCMAAFIEQGTINNILNCAGKFTVSFNCQPQRYLVTGDNTICVYGTDSVDKLYNPTAMRSEPLIKISGIFTSGENLIGIDSNAAHYQISFDGDTSYSEVVSIEIDSELKECYARCEHVVSGQVVNRYVLNLNNAVSLPNGFPLLNPGRNTVGVSSASITKVEVIPRWWII